MQATVAIVKNVSRRKKTAFIAVLGFMLLLLGLIALFSLGSKTAKFDAAYDAGESLSAFFFAGKDGAQGLSALETLWLGVVRYRIAPMLLGVLLIALYVVLNRELLYSQAVAPYVFVLPFVLTFLIFFLYPFISTVLMSFQDIKATSSAWIGFDNYRNLFSNKTFYAAVTVSLRYMLITCALLIPIPLLLAYMLNSRSMKLGGMFKTISFMPVLCSVVVGGIVFRMMFSELPGALMNQLLIAFGGKPIAWLKGEWTSMFAMVLLCCWRWTGMNILYYMAGLKSIPAELYEAADIDGANAVHKFTHIAWPLLKPTTIYVLTISIYAGLSMFTESYMIFGNNSSPKNYGLTIVGYLYRYGFEKVDKFGFASAVGLVLLAGAMIITVLQLRLTGVIGGKHKEG